MNQSNIRNFAIVAHIDHGKSTLADRLLEMTGTVDKRHMQEQLLDSNPIERERGITIKLAPVRMVYQYTVGSGQFTDENKKTANSELQTVNYILNLIDTPGHVDFNYEVSRSLAACEGAILVVDATQGVQAQTLANLALARKQSLAIIPVINKIDLPNARIEESLDQLRNLGFKEDEIIQISAKTGTNVDQVLKAIVSVIPPPSGGPAEPLRALVFSSQFDTHKGVVVYVRVVDGSINAGPAARQPQKLPSKGEPNFWVAPARVTRLAFLASGAEIEPIEIGYFNPEMKASSELRTGEVGYIATGLKDVGIARVGDTITQVQSSKFKVQKEREAIILGRSVATTPESEIGTDPGQARMTIKPLPGYKEPKPMVFLGLFPIQSNEINQVREALGKLRLSDSAFSFRPIHSLALGNGFHCGFLGLLHAEVVQERLSREFNLSLLATAPTVEYRIKLKNHNSPQPSLSLREGVKVPPLRIRGAQAFGSEAAQAQRGKLRSQRVITIQSASEFPDPSLIEEAQEPMMEVTIFSPKDYVGQIMELCQSRRAEFIDLNYLAGDQIKFTYIIPLSEMIVDFFDQLKSISEGYASLDYEFFDRSASLTINPEQRRRVDFQKVDLVKLDILLNHEKVDAFSQLVVSGRAEQMGRKLVDKLKDVIPRQQFAIPIQAAIGGKIIARADVKPFRKDVTKKLYGGDRTRKDKLLEAQRKGKKRMKMVGQVEIPQEAFLKVFKSG